MKKFILGLFLLLQSLTSAQMLYWGQLFSLNNNFFGSLNYSKSLNTLYGINYQGYLTGFNLSTKTSKTYEQTIGSKFNLLNDTILIALKDGDLNLSEDNLGSWRKISNVYINDYHLDKSRLWVLTNDRRIGYTENLKDWFYIAKTFDSNILELHAIDSFIVVRTELQLFRSLDLGETWQDLNMSYLLGLLLTPNKTIYCSNYNYIFYSIDSGRTWKNNQAPINFSSYSKLLTDVNSNIYTNTYEKTIKSSNQGKYWTQFAPEKAEGVLFTDSLIFYSSYTGVYKLDSSKVLNTGNNYFPLAVGNKFRYYGEVSYDIGTKSSLEEHEIKETKIVNNKIYYRLDHYFYNYNDSNKILYVLTQSDKDSVYIDFNLPDSSFIPNGKIFRKNEIYFGKSRQVFVKAIRDDVYGWFEERYAEGLGLVKYSHNYSGRGGGGSSDEQLIEAHIADSTGKMIYFTKGYLPSISCQTMKIINDPSLKFPVTVNHPWSNTNYWFGQVEEGTNFTDTVWIKMYYKKGGETIHLDSAFAKYIGKLRYEFTITPDTSLLNSGYKLYYKIFARDKKYIPSIVSYPTNYAEAIYEPAPLSVNEGNELAYELTQNYPNPFNPKTEIRYSVRESGRVKLLVYDLLGNVVSTLVDENKTAGNYSIVFDGSSLASGIYFYKLEVNDFTSIKKMVILK